VSTDVKGVDEPTLEEAQRVLGTQTPSDTVNAALREVVRKRLVEEFFSLMSERDPTELENLRAEAWR
jgi:Arc/MetJ family transcription regulator